MSKFVHKCGQEMLGKDGLREVKRYAEALKLPSCPFCGGKAQVVLGVFDYKPHVVIRCGKCFCTTKFINAGYHEPEGNDDPKLWSENVKEAIAASAVRWSCRQ